MQKRSRLAKTILGFALVGLLITLYIEVSTLLVGSPQCLGGGGGCKTVENSVYSHIQGIPVVYFGIVGYLALVINLVLNRAFTPVFNLFMALIGFGTEAYLVYLQAFKINAFCQWCMASVVIMTIIFILSVIWWLKVDDEKEENFVEENIEPKSKV